jgi:hypothetical protein
MATKIDKNSLADTGKLLIHDVGNFVHKVSMELDLAEGGQKKLKYADLASAVDSMSHSLEDLRVHLVKINARIVALKPRRR